MFAKLKQNFKSRLITMSALLSLAFGLAAPATVSAAAQIENSVCGGANNLSVDTPTAGQCAATKTAGTGGVNNIIKTIINVFSIIVGVVAVIMIIYAGFRYVTSGGSQEAIKTAKTTLIYAIVGLIIVVLAQIIVKFVLAKATSTVDCTKTPNAAECKTTGGTGPTGGGTTGGGTTGGGGSGPLTCPTELSPDGTCP